jgi:leucyl aminopeptidase (aminopeptidase T)
MAKKKAEAPAVETAVVESPENVETVVETTQETTDEVVEQPQTENSEEVTEAKAEEVTEAKAEEPVAKAPKQKKAATAEPEIPANVQRILKAFNNMPELYVSSTGRVFTPGAKPSLRGNAILYKNPFYNSKS